MKKGEHQSCEICGDPYYAAPWEIKRGSRFCSHSCYSLSRMTGECRNCEVCGKEIYTIPSRLKLGYDRFCSYACKGRAMEGKCGPDSRSWKGGICFRGDGYLAIHFPDHPHAVNGYVFLHRLLMEEILGRFLEPGEVVHHVNEDISDNRPENLQLFPSKSEHTKYHMNKGGVKNP